MNNVQCSGSESRLIDCPHSSGGSGSDARLTCPYYSNGKYYNGKYSIISNRANIYLDESTILMTVNEASSLTGQNYIYTLVEQ